MTCDRRNDDKGNGGTTVFLPREMDVASYGSGNIATLNTEYRGSWPHEQASGDLSAQERITMQAVGASKGPPMPKLARSRDLTLTVALATLLSAGAALANDAAQAPSPPGQSVTGPASQRATGNAGAVSTPSASSSPARSQPEKPDGRNNGESDTPKEETPGVKSSTTNSF